MTKIPEATLSEKIKDRTINPKMQRRDVALITGARHPQTKLRRRSKRDERVLALNEQIEGLNAHIEELEAARALDFTEVDDEAAARQILGWFGKERPPRLIAELQRLIGGASEAA